MKRWERRQRNLEDYKSSGGREQRLRNVLGTHMVDGKRHREGGRKEMETEVRGNRVDHARTSGRCQQAGRYTVGNPTHLITTCSKCKE